MSDVIHSTRLSPRHNQLHAVAQSMLQAQHLSWSNYGTKFAAWMATSRLTATAKDIATAQMGPISLVTLKGRIHLKICIILAIQVKTVMQCLPGTATARTVNSVVGLTCYCNVQYCPFHNHCYVQYCPCHHHCYVQYCPFHNIMFAVSLE